MRTLLQFVLPALMLLATPAFAQKKDADKSKRPSPPATVTQTIAGGATITIDYSQPSVKGRTIGKDLEPLDGQVWRLGANEATVFTTDKNLIVGGSPLPAGKYALFCVNNSGTWTLIFNKVWKTWGAYEYEKNAGSDAARVDLNLKSDAPQSERLTFNIAKDGTIRFNWGNYEASTKAEAAK